MECEDWEEFMFVPCHSKYRSTGNWVGVLLRLSPSSTREVWITEVLENTLQSAEFGAGGPRCRTEVSRPGMTCAEGAPLALS